MMRFTAWPWALSVFWKNRGPIDASGAWIGVQAPITAGYTHPRGHAELTTMTTKQYLAALAKLGLTPHAKLTAQSLGLSLRQCQRIAAGDSPVPETLAKLLRLMIDKRVKPENIA